MKDIKLQIKYRTENMQLLKEGQFSIKKKILQYKYLLTKVTSNNRNYIEFIWSVLNSMGHVGLVGHSRGSMWWVKLVDHSRGLNSWVILVGETRESFSWVILLDQIKPSCEV